MFFDRIKTSAPLIGRKKPSASGPKIVFSDDFENVRLPDPAPAPENSSHNTATIFRQKEITDIWICPECECENVLSSGECSVCHFHL